MANKYCKSVEIPRVQHISKEDFRKDHLSIGAPLIIEGITHDWPANEWSLDSLCEIVGDNPVNVRTNTSCEEYRLGVKYSIRETTFRKYVEDLKSDNKRSRNSYMAVQNIRKALPQLESHFKVPEYVGKLHSGPFLWIAHAGHYEYCHFDPDDGFLIILQGSKDVRLYGCDTGPLYPNPKGSRGRTVQAQVNCDSPDLEEHPLFKEAVCYYNTLNPGDMLFIPAFWWHQVTSVSTAISINMFWGDAGQNTYLTKVMSDSRKGSFHYWLLNIVEQNQEFPSFLRTLSRLPEALDNFIMNQWHEQATEEQLQTLVALIMNYLDISELPNEASGGKHPPPLQIRGLVWR